MVVAEQVQQPVQREDAEFGLFRVSGGLRLPPRHAASNDNVAEMRRVGRERQHIGSVVAPAVCLVQRPDTRVAHDGPTALRIAAAFEPEVAVLDLGMPVMDGFEIAARLRSGVRCVAVTGYGQENDLRKSRDAGFQAHFVKPVNLERLLDAVDAPE